MSKLTDTLHQQPVIRQGSTCKVALIIPKLDDESAQDLAELIADLNVNAELIGRTLRAMGHPIQGQTIARHRRGDCLCE